MPVEDADAHDAAGLPGAGYEEGSALVAYAGDDAVSEGVVIGLSGGGAGVEETDESLVDVREVDELDARELGEGLGEGVGVTAATIDEVSDAGGAELA